MWLLFMVAKRKTAPVVSGCFCHSSIKSKITVGTVEHITFYKRIYLWINILKPRTLDIEMFEWFLLI